VQVNQRRNQTSIIAWTNYNNWSTFILFMVTIYPINIDESSFIQNIYLNNETLSKKSFVEFVTWTFVILVKNKN
jgi:hypothetical protein